MKGEVERREGREWAGERRKEGGIETERKKEGGG